VAWVQFWEGYWYNDSTGQTSAVEPYELIYARTPEGVKAAAYADGTLFGYGGRTVQLLDQAAAQLGITVPDWTPYARGIIRRDSINGGLGWMWGAADAYVANHILRELSYDPAYSATFNALSPAALQQIRNAGGAPSVAQGLYAPSSAIFQETEAAGYSREADLRARYAAEQEFQFSDLIPIIIAAGFTAGLAGVLPGAVAAEAAPVVSAAAVEAAPALVVTEAAPVVSAAVFEAAPVAVALEAAPAVVSAELFGPVVLDASAWSTGSAALLNPAVEAATLGTLANVAAVVPSGYVVNLANSAQLVAESLLPAIAAPAVQLPTPSLPQASPPAAPASAPSVPAPPAPAAAPVITPSSLAGNAITTAVKTAATGVAASVLSQLTGEPVQAANIPPPSNNVLGAWALLGIGGAVAIYFIFKG